MAAPTVADMTTTPYHPWRELREMTHIDVQWVDLPDGHLALSDEDTIWMERRQRQAQRRSTLAHELEHRRLGHVGCQPASVEAAVEEAAARRLIPLVALAEAVVWSMSHEELSLELWVDLGMVHTRLRTLSASEQTYIEDVIARREEAL